MLRLSVLLLFVVGCSGRSPGDTVTVHETIGFASPAAVNAGRQLFEADPAKFANAVSLSTSHHKLADSQAVELISYHEPPAGTNTVAVWKIRAGNVVCFIEESAIRQ